MTHAYILILYAIFYIHFVYKSKWCIYWVVPKLSAIFYKQKLHELHTVIAMCKN